MLEVHLSIFVIEDSILDNMSDIERDIMNDDIIEQGPLGRHFTHIGCRDEIECDEVMPYLGDVGQMFGLEVHYVPFIVKFSFALPVCQHPKNFRIVRDFVEPIIGFRVNRLKVIIFIDRLRTEVYQNSTHLDPFQYLGG